MDSANDFQLSEPSSQSCGFETHRGFKQGLGHVTLVPSLFVALPRRRLATLVPAARTTSAASLLFDFLSLSISLSVFAWLSLSCCDSGRWQRTLLKGCRNLVLRMQLLLINSSFGKLGVRPRQRPSRPETTKLEPTSCRISHGVR